MSDSITYDGLVNELLRRLPAFAAARASDKSYVSHDDDSPYLVFGDFGRFLTDLIANESHASEPDRVLADSFQLLGEMATSFDDEVVNVAETAVFEILTDSPETVGAARKHLPEKALPVFERVVSLWSSPHHLLS